MFTPQCMAMMAVVAIVSVPAGATNYTKLDTTSLQLNTSNWSGTPTAADVGEFGGTPASTTLTNLTLGGNVVIGGLQFDNNMAGPVTIGSGNTLTLYEAGIAASSANQNVTINCAIALGASQAWNMAAGNTLTINNAVTGNYALTNEGSGTLTLSSWNVAMSILNVAAGSTVELSGNGGGGSAITGSGTVMIDGGSTDWRPTANNQPFTGTFLTKDSGCLNFASSATMGWSSNATYILNGPHMYLYGVNGAIDLGALSGSTTIGTWNAWTPTLSVGARGDSTTFAGTIINTAIGSGGGVVSLIKTGAGTLTLSGANTFTGTTVINGGTLTLAQSAALQGSTLDYNDYGGHLSFGTLTAATLGALTGGQDLALVNNTAAAVALTVGNNGQSSSYGGVLSGAGSLVKAGIGVFTFTNSATYSGNTMVNTGTLAISGGGRLGGGTYAGAITVNGVFNYNSSAAQTISGAITGGGTLVHSGSGTLTLPFWCVAMSSLHVAAGSTVELSGCNGGGCSITGSGTIIIDGSSTDWRPYVNNQPFTGTFLTQGNGVIDFCNSPTLGWSSNATYILNGPRLQISIWNGTIDLGALSGNATIGTWHDDCTPTLSVGARGDSTTFAGTIVNSVDGHGGVLSLIKTGIGTLTLSGANTYTGATTISGGMLAINGSLAGGSAVTVQSGGTLGGTGTVSGMTTVQSGGTIAAGDPDTAGGAGVLTVASNVTFQTNGVLSVHFKDGQCNRLVVGGTADISSATFGVSFGNEAESFSGVYTALVANVLTGQFAGIPDKGQIKVGLARFEMSYTSQAVLLRRAGGMLLIVQ